MRFVDFYKLVFFCSVTGETVETTTDQRNSSIIGSDDVHISFTEIGEKDMKVSLFYLMHPANSNSRENSGILTRFPCFMSNF